MNASHHILIPYNGILRISILGVAATAGLTFTIKAGGVTTTVHSVGFQNNLWEIAVTAGQVYTVYVNNPTGSPIVLQGDPGLNETRINWRIERRNR